MEKITNNEAGIEGDWDMNDTLVYNTKMYNHLNNLRHNKLDSPETYKAMKQYKEHLDHIDKTKNYTCSRIQNKDMHDARYKYCNYKAETREELMAHERTCFNIRETTGQINHKYLECNLCGKKFYDKGQKLKPIYALNHHKTICKSTLDKRRKAHIKKFLLNASSEDTQEIFNIVMAKQKKQENPNLELTHETNLQLTYENIKKITKIDSESDNESDRPVSAVSTATTNSNYSEWHYDNIYYFVDNKNRVYDEYDNHIGKRVIEEFSGEFKLELE
jgi:hypothetical protein